MESPASHIGCLWWCHLLPSRRRKKGRGINDDGVVHDFPRPVLVASQYFPFRRAVSRALFSNHTLFSNFSCRIRSLTPCGTLRQVPWGLPLKRALLWVQAPVVLGVKVEETRAGLMTQYHRSGSSPVRYRQYQVVRLHATFSQRQALSRHPRPGTFCWWCVKRCRCRGVDGHQRVMAFHPRHECID